MVAFHKHTVFVPLIGSGNGRLPGIDDPALSLGVNDHFVTSASKNTSALLFVKHAVVLGVVCHDITLIPRDHIESKIGSGSTTILDATVSARGYFYFDAKIKVANG